MDAKMEMVLGAAAIVLGLACLIPHGWRESFFIVVGGLIALVLLLLGALFVFMGFIQAKEDRANRQKEQQDAERRAAMASDAA